MKQFVPATPVQSFAQGPVEKAPQISKGKGRYIILILVTAEFWELIHLKLKFSWIVWSGVELL